MNAGLLANPTTTSAMPNTRTGTRSCIPNTFSNMTQKELLKLASQEIVGKMIDAGLIESTVEGDIWQKEIFDIMYKAVFAE